MERDKGPCPGGVLLGARGDRRSVQDERVRLERLERLFVGVDEERLCEERVPGALRDDADGDSVPGIGAGIRVHDVDVFLLQAGDDLVAQTLERLLRERGVHLRPPDALFRLGLADDELVLRRATRVDAGVDDERASLGEAALAAGECVRVELRRRRVPVDATADVDAVLAEPLAAWDDRDHVLVQVIFTTVPFSRPPYGKRGAHAA